ncbi:hypothetical protein UFOVP71_425 [uncultured Caudovirales phage]|uniref:Uncharacterized protein n=1 Tax=uncultured Caudovirales phage TaxID=2100421 RepID=A0A6J5TD81_9CAUD|nr:hypothetical protein UFOVP71_425 [uncultured Caudovirales phage]
MLNNTPNGWRPAITKIALTLVLVYVISICISVIAAAFVIESEWNCGSSKEVYTLLSNNGEEIVATGTVGDKFLMTLWAGRDSEWSVVVTSVKTFELSCIVIYGNNYKKLKEKTFI